MCGFEGHEWLIYFLNECYYVYDLFGHGKVIAQSQALIFLKRMVNIIVKYGMFVYRCLLK
jgi:hypothetical protein